MINRRQFVKNLTVASSAAYFAQPLSLLASSEKEVHISCQQYPWTTFMQREGQDWNANLTESIKMVAKSGIKGFEPSYEKEEQVKSMRELLKEYEFESKSIYVNSILHDLTAYEASIKEAVKIAKEAKKHGAEIVVTNPTPIRWGGTEDKNDDQLKVQAHALNELGSQIRKAGMTLAYHNHDAEMRQGAREFHHMMLGTDPKNVKLCLDAHWIYRGSGNSQIALFDIIKLYGDRIVELHLRQSENGIWTEAFGQGDIDYERIAFTLLEKKIKPHLVLKQAVEEGTPNTLNMVVAHQKSLEYAKAVFKDFA
ncbi:MAG: TIM barrel protein [Bacteroidia bacterium]